ncbi:EIN3-binding F-box protein 1-like [Aristolochia californica]|uniref:EIN3-binding F-box protein 1-like n=1 Tax=Aristolochia californica TaxID=171875 RepID=UPI0035DC6A7A
MPTLVNCSGDEDFCSAGSMYSNLMDSSLILSLGPYVDVYCPPRKRSRISAPFVFCGEVEQERQASIDVLPDECLFEIFRRLEGGQERSASACVSKRWLLLQSSMRRTEIYADKPVLTGAKADESSKPKDTPVEEIGEESDGHLSRCLEGKKATDLRLAAIAVGTSRRGGLGKLSIRGSNSIRRVTNLGLSAVARGCPSLRVLSLWNVSSVGDEGLFEIADGCPMLEKLDLCQCPLISDKGLVSIAKKCPKLTTVTIEGCSNIGNESLEAFGRFCPNLTAISVKDCPLVGDQGIASLMSSASSVINKIKLQALNVTDVSLAVIGHYGKAVTDLSFTGLYNVTERGFWVLGNAVGLQKLKTFTIISCQGVTDLGLEAVGKGCPNLKQFNLRRCLTLSDEGLKAFTRSATSLESLLLEECNRITQAGVLGALSNCGDKLKALSLVKCMGIRETLSGLTQLSPCKSLRYLAICNCPGFGSAGLAMVGKLCPKLQHLDLEGICGATDAGLLMLLESCEAGLVKVNLAGCINVSDAVVSALTRLHGESLEVLNLDGCRKITDGSLVAISNNCSVLVDLDVSKSGVSDFGVATLASAKQLDLQILSLSGCSNVSDKSISFLRNLACSLVGLNLQLCSSMSSRAVELLGEQLWRCDILY